MWSSMHGRERQRPRKQHFALTAVLPRCCLGNSLYLLLTFSVFQRFPVRGHKLDYSENNWCKQAESTIFQICSDAAYSSSIASSVYPSPPPSLSFILLSSRPVFPSRIFPPPRHPFCNLWICLASLFPPVLMSLNLSSLLNLLYLLSFNPFPLSSSSFLKKCFLLIPCFLRPGPPP